jgi:thioesterase domain-containing protein/acyl carrier protein
MGATITDTSTIRRESLALPTPYEDPNTEREILIARLFAEVFDVDQIGVNDDFFDIGGDSLLAETLSLAISEHTGCEFQLSSLVEHGSPRQIAELLDGKLSNTAAPQAPAGQRLRPPIFIVHGRDGLTFPKPEFRRALADGQRLFMFELPGIRGGRYYDLIEDIATVYVAQLEEHHKEGPIFLASFCMGALIVLEMAAQLAKKGRPVRQLVLLDPGIPKKEPVGSGYAYRLDPAETARADWKSRLQRFVQFRPARSKKTTMAERFRRRLEKKQRAGRVKHPGLQLSLDALAKLRAAYRLYRPVPFGGAVAILSSRDRESVFRDPSHAWNELLPRRQVHVVMEHHQEVGGAATASMMQSIFDAALAEVQP